MKKKVLFAFFIILIILISIFAFFVLNKTLFTPSVLKQSAKPEDIHRLVTFHENSVGPGFREEVKLEGRTLSYQNQYVVNPVWKTTTISQEDYMVLQNYFFDNKLWQYEGEHNLTEDELNKWFEAGNGYPPHAGDMRMYFTYHPETISAQEIQFSDPIKTEIACVTDCPNTVYGFNFKVFFLVEKYFPEAIE